MKNKAKADGRRFIYLATAISALGGMLFGYDIGVISGAARPRHAGNPQLEVESRQSRQTYGTPVRCGGANE